MNDRPEIKQRWFQSLQVKVVFLLALALLPIGLIAVLQAAQVDKEFVSKSHSSVLAATERAAHSEQIVIERAVGAAKLLTHLAPQFIDDAEACARYLGTFIDENDNYSFAGIVPTSGITRCSSTGEIRDLSSLPNFENNFASQRANVTVNAAAPLSGTSVIIVSEPFMLDGEFGGFVSISIPHDELIENTAIEHDIGLQDLILFNRKGDVLSSKSGLNNVEERLPATAPLETLIWDGSRTFSVSDKSGEDRVYAVVPAHEDRLYVMGIWDPLVDLPGDARFAVPASLFPLLMWIMSLTVAFIAIHRFMGRHVAHLRLQMTQFASNRQFIPGQRLSDMPSEMAEIDASFTDMAESIIRDEAALENAVREKNILIKEIHHRVKNNLQLISSIINMQVRETSDEETKKGLRSIQERVISLATIHRDLYSDQNNGRINAGRLVAEIIRKNSFISTALLSGDLEVEVDAQDVFLFPDQAVPLSLLVAEMTAKIYENMDDETKHFQTRVTLDEGGLCSIVQRIVVSETEKPTNTLRDQLITAFATQLEADVSERITDGMLELRVVFQPQTDAHETVDY